MDQLDKAGDLENMHRDIALKRQLATRQPPQQIVEGQALCVDCDEPLCPERLAALPSAARCIHCQSLAERRGGR